MSDMSTPVEDDVLYADTYKALTGLRKRMLFIMLPLVLFSFVVSGALIHLTHVVQPVLQPMPSPQTVHPAPARAPLAVTLAAAFPWFLLAECILLSALVARSHKKQQKPIIVLSPAGIAVDTQGTHLGLIRWDEVADIRCYTFIYRYVGIVPVNVLALSRRLGRGRSWLLVLSAAVLPLYKAFGVFVAPINIPQVFLPISADELLVRIQAYQVAHAPPFTPWAQGAAVPERGTWPPPPHIPR